MLIIVLCAEDRQLFLAQNIAFIDTQYGQTIHCTGFTPYIRKSESMLFVP